MIHTHTTLRSFVFLLGAIFALILPAAAPATSPSHEKALVAEVEAATRALVRAHAKPARPAGHPRHEASVAAKKAALRAAAKKWRDAVAGAMAFSVTLPHVLQTSVDCGLAAVREAAEANPSATIDDKIESLIRGILIGRAAAEAGVPTPTSVRGLLGKDGAQQK